MKIAIANLLSGSGKTTLAAQLGLALADRGHSVLLVDATPTNGLEERIALSERGTVLDRRASLILRDSTQAKLRVLTGVGRALADSTLESGPLEPLFEESAITIVDTAAEPTMLARALVLADRAFVPLAESRQAYATLPATLRVFHEVKRRLPSFDLGGFIRCEVRGAISSEDTRATATQIAEEFPDLFLSAAMPFDDNLSRRADAAARPLDGVLSIADEIAARGGLKSGRRAGFLARLLGRN